MKYENIRNNLIQNLFTNIKLLDKAVLVLEISYKLVSLRSTDRRERRILIRILFYEFFCFLSLLMIENIKKF